MAEETRATAEQVKAALGDPGMVVAKAKLFDEKVHEEKKLSGSRIVRILDDYAERIEEAMARGRKAADRMEESSRRLTGATCSKDINLSELSLPESFAREAIPGEGKDRTPESRKAGRVTTPAKTPNRPIELDSEPGSGQGGPVPGAAGERSRNLNDVFEGMDAEAKSPTIGSAV